MPSLRQSVPVIGSRGLQGSAPKRSAPGLKSMAEGRRARFWHGWRRCGGHALGRPWRKRGPAVVSTMPPGAGGARLRLPRCSEGRDAAAAATTWRKPRCAQRAATGYACCPFGAYAATMARLHRTRSTRSRSLSVAGGHFGHDFSGEATSHNTLGARLLCAALALITTGSLPRPKARSDVTSVPATP